MARTPIPFPEPPLFSTDIEVRVTDLNYGNHLGNDACAGLLHEARVRWLRQHGWSEGDAGGIGVILVELHIVFRAESGLGDRLRVDLSARRSSRRSFDLFYRVTDTGTGRTVADARSAMVCFDYDARRVGAIPPALTAILEAARDDP